MSNTTNRTGIVRHGNGWRVSVSQGRHRPQLRRQFPLATPVAAMQAWRRDAVAKTPARKTRALAGTLEVDAARYLDAVKALPTWKDREREIALWVAVLGHKRRDAITAVDVRTCRDRWLTTPRSLDDDRPVSGATVNKRLRALSNLYTVLDGKRAANPVRDVPEADEADAEPRALPYEAIQAILDQMPTHRHGQWTKNAPPADWTPTGVSLARIRVRLMAYTGQEFATLIRLKPSDVDYDRGLLRLPSRKKGKGVAAAVVPLLPPAAEAFRELAALDAFGRFNLRTVRHAFTRAAAAAGYPGARLKDLRHSLGTVAYDLTQSREVVMALLQHASLKTSQRYTLAAALRVLEHQTAPLVRHFGSQERTP